MTEIVVGYSLIGVASAIGFGLTYLERRAIKKDNLHLVDGLMSMVQLALVIGAIPFAIWLILKLKVFLL